MILGPTTKLALETKWIVFFLSQKNGDILTIKKNKKNYQFVFIFALPLQCHDAFDGGEKEEEEVGGHGDGL